MRSEVHWVVVVGLLLCLPAPARPATITVSPGASVQAAIDAALPGDVVQLEPGTYVEDIDFAGKAITVRGAGPTTILQGTGAGPVVTMVSGEPPESVLDSLLVTGGRADRGGGIAVQGGSPTIVRNVIVGNRARMQGSGLYLAATGALIANNLIVYNGRDGSGDPHSLEIQSGAPLVLNNTVARGDSNGLIVRSGAAPVIMNNLIAYNGSVVDNARRGRGICDFSGGLALIHYNLFHANRVAALLTDGRDFRRIRRAEAEIGPPRLVGNVGGRPELPGRVPRDPTAVTADAFRLGSGARPRARDAGNPDPQFGDLDGTRNDIGFTGGPAAPAWLD